MNSCVTLPVGSSDPSRLRPDEVEALVNFTFIAHDHNARTPQKPIFWWRTDDDVARHWN